MRLKQGLMSSSGMAVVAAEEAMVRLWESTAPSTTDT